MIKKTCDICRLEVDDVTPIVDCYKTIDIEHISSSCDKRVADFQRYVNRWYSKAKVSWTKRVMQRMRGDT